MKEEVMSRMKERLSALAGDGGTVLSTSQIVRSLASESSGGMSPGVGPIAERQVSLG